MKTCPKCGEQYSDNAEVCSSCGYVQPENVVEEIPAKPAAETIMPAADPVEQKAKRSVSSLVGVIFAGSYVLASVVFWQLSAIESYYETEISAKWIFFILGLVCLPVGLFVSIGATVSAGVRRNEKSKKTGVLGIVGSGGCFVLNIVVLVIVLVCGIVEFNRFELKDYDAGNYVIRYKTNDHTQAEARTYYWDGDPQNNHIKPESVNGTKIVRLDYFEIKVVPYKDYYKTTNYDRYLDPLDSDPKYKSGFRGVEPGTLIKESTVTFVIEISKDIEKIWMDNTVSSYRPRELGVLNFDGSISFYKYFIYFEVDPDNPNYYSKDGILYSKRNNKKVYALYNEHDAESYTNSSWYAPGETSEVTDETETEITETETRTMIFGTGSEKINLWSFTDEVPKMVDQYIKMHPEFGMKYTVECTIIATDGGCYQTALDNALVAGGDDAPDIYTAEDAFVVKYSQGDMAKFASTYKDLGIDVDAKIKEADIAKYSVEIGSRDGNVVALGYQATGCAMIYNAEIAKEVFGTDDPEKIEKIVGAGSGDWDKFLEAAEKLKSKGYAIVSGPDDVWNACNNSAKTPWVVDGKLNVDSNREKYLDLAKTIKDKGYSNNGNIWSESWYQDMKGEGEKKVFAFFGPAWLINYVMVGNSGLYSEDGGTYGKWRVCAPPVGFHWGGTWIFAGKDTDQKAGVAELIEWITLDPSDTGLQYLWANGLVDWDNDPETKTAKDTVASAVVMDKSDGSLDFCGWQNIFPAFIKGNNLATGKGVSQYDGIIRYYYEDAAQKYVAGEIDKIEVMEQFKQQVKENIAF